MRSQQDAQKLTTILIWQKLQQKFVADKVAETDGKIAYHELQEAAYEFMKGYAKRRIKAFKNGK